MSKIYHKTCGLPGCEVEFDTTMERKKYHSQECTEAANKLRALARHKMRINQKYNCMMCGRPRCSGPHEHCWKCKDLIGRSNVDYTLGLYHVEVDC